MSAGEDFVRRIRPLGCALFLILAVAVTVLCFTLNNDPVKGYEAPEDTAYYAAHPEALAAELEEHIFPALEGDESAQVTGDGKVLVTLEEAYYYPSRGAILQYFDVSLLEFQQAE